MKNPLKRESKLDRPINRILEEMEMYGPNTSEFDRLLDELERVSALKTTETWWQRMDPSQAAAVVANLAGVALIVNHERLNVVTSKALSMLFRSKTQP